MSYQPRLYLTPICDSFTAASNRAIIEGKPRVFKMHHRTPTFVLTLPGVAVSMSIHMDGSMYGQQECVT